MKIVPPFSPWPFWGDLPVPRRGFPYRRRAMGLASRNLNPSINSTPTWFLFAPINFMDPRARALCFVRSPLHPDPILFGGGHENDRRAGTENMAGIAGFTDALVRFAAPPVFCAKTLGPLTARLIERLRTLDGVEFRGSARQRLSNTAAFTVAGCREHYVCWPGWICWGFALPAVRPVRRGSLEPSHVFAALGVEPPLANSLIDFPWAAPQLWKKWMPFGRFSACH